MSRERKRQQQSVPKNWRDLCSQLGPDDGVDPRDFGKDRQNRSKHKDWQLCRHVFETLSYVLSGETGDEVLQNLNVIEVTPAPDARRLLVAICPIALDHDFDPNLALQRLKESIGRLRTEIARSICRRKVPELAFRILQQDPSTTEVRDDQ
jgi:ribosome-binding factor A